MSFGSMATAIIAFTAVTSYTTMAIIPIGLGPLALPLALLKVALVSFWLWAAWRVKKKRDEAIRRKTEEGRLWIGPIEEKALGIPVRDLDVIRYHLDKDEKIIRVARQHRFILWHAFADLTMVFVLIVGALLLLKYGVAIQWHPKDTQMWDLNWINLDLPLWWIPLLPVLFFFYEALAHWQDWKWKIRIITNRRLILLREQSTYMPWTGKAFRHIPVHQLLQTASDGDGLKGTIGWYTLELTVRADEHDDKPEKVILDYVGDDAFQTDLDAVMPVNQNKFGPPQPIVEVEVDDQPVDEAPTALQAQASLATREPDPPEG